MPVPLLALCFAGALASPLLGVERPVTVSISTLDHQNVEATLSWHEATGDSIPIERGNSIELSTPWSGQIDLDCKRRWRLEIEAEGYWAPTVEWDFATELSSLEVQLERASAIVGRVQPTEHLETSPQASLRVWIHRGESSQLVWQALRCESSRDVFRCITPLGDLDLKLSSEGAVPIYRWNQLLTEEALDVGSIRWRAGGSVSGRALIDTETEEQGTIQLRLKPRVTGFETETANRERQELRSLETLASEEGLFTVGPAPAGAYDLVASTEGMPPVVVENLDLTEPIEIVLDEIIELVSPPALDVYLTPPVGPELQPWTVILMRPRSGSHTYETLHRSGAAFDGHWHLASVPQGTYRLAVRDFRGATWLVRELELDPPRERLFFEMDSVGVRGTLTLDDEPQNGMVVFGTRQGRPNVALEAVDGIFTGVLPREGIWDVEVEIKGGSRISLRTEPVTLERPAGNATAEVAIELPDTLLEGEVRQGFEPVADAFVLVRGDAGGNKRILARLRTREDGTFRVRGLNPTRVEVAAYLGAHDPASEWVGVELREDSQTPSVVLDLASKVEYQARVFSGQGPVSGAQIFIDELGPSSETRWPAQAISNTEGVGRFRLPATSRGNPVLLLTVGAGFGVVMQVESLGGRAIPVPISSEKGDLVLRAPLGTLYYEGAPIGVPTLIQRLHAASRIAVHPEGGVILEGMAVGNYRQCPQAPGHQGCSEGVLASGGSLELQAFPEAAASQEGRSGDGR